MNTVTLSRLLFCSLYIVYCESHLKSESSTAIEIEERLTTQKSALSIEAEDLLELEGIKNADPNVKRFAKKHVKQAKDHQKELYKERDRAAKAEFEKENDLVYKSILVVRSQIELLENELLPKNFKQSNDRYSRWIIILNSEDGRVKPVLDRVLFFYKPMSRKEAIETFARALQKIYGDLCEKPHNTYSRKVLEILQNDNAARKQLLDELRVPPVEIYTKALEVIAVELKMAGKKDEKADDCPGLNNLKCVTILPSKDSFKNAKNEDGDVYKFFPTTKPKKVVFKKGEKTLADSFTVHFDDVFASVEAIDNNYGWLKGQKVILRLDQCDGD